MKDIFGKDIKVGDYIIYIQSFDCKHLEKAIVVESEETFVKIEYLGVSTYPLKEYCKQQGKKGRITSTDKKVIVINAEDNENTVIDTYRKEKDRFDEEIKKIKSKLTNAMKREKLLLKKNESLQAEVEKIHSRFDILDL